MHWHYPHLDAGDTSSWVLTFTASTSADDYLPSFGQSATVSYTAGDYRWQVYITRFSGEVETLAIKRPRTLTLSVEGFAVATSCLDNTLDTIFLEVE